MANQQEFEFPMKRKREPKIVVFEEEKYSGRVIKDGSSILKKKRNKNRESSEDVKTSEEDDTEFTNIAREVKEFGMTGFSKKEQRKNQQKYAEHLGAHKKKNLKVPYPLLMERIKQKKGKEEKQRKIEESMGVYKKKKKSENVNLVRKHNLGRWVDKSKVDGIGKKNTFRRINKQELRKIQNMKIHR